MAAIETYSKFHIIHEQFQNFNEVMGRLRDNLLLRRSGLLRADLFIGRQANEAVVLMAYERVQDFIKTDGLVRKFFSELSGIARVASEIVGSVSGNASLALADCYTREHQFAFGLRPVATPSSFVRAPGAIETCSQFQFKPEQLETHKQSGAHMVQFVKRNEPGTRRFDWFFDEATSHGFVMGSLADADSLLVHIENGQKMQAEFKAMTPMTTDFLGARSMSSSSADIDRHPYMLRFHASLISLG